MVEIVQGDLFEADAAALVNPVHCAGLMKRGLCRQFKTRFPDNFEQYKAACGADALAPGDVLVHDRGGLFGDAQQPRYLLNVATKDHWRDDSSAAYIEAGMAAVADAVTTRGLSSLAVPALGCGGGGLDWSTVRPLLTAPLAALEGVQARVYAPRSAQGRGGASASEPPAMTQGRAELLLGLAACAAPDARIHPHAAHNLAFLLQGMGAALHLSFEPGAHGLRAAGLSAVLRHIDGHFIDGYDPSHQDSPFGLHHGATETAERTVMAENEAAERHDQIRDLLEEGRAAPTLDLLATVGWLVRHDASVRRRPEAAVRAVQDWSRREAERFSPAQITTAWQQLHRHGWEPAAGPTGSGE
jgi:O-acetyl-ADP-ribose deacetylase (regulator of RNase III)